MEPIVKRAEYPTVTIIDGPKFALEISNCTSAAQVIGMLRIALNEYENMVLGDGTMRVVGVLQNHVVMEATLKR